jgi:hypothetical protein
VLIGLHVQVKAENGKGTFLDSRKAVELCGDLIGAGHGPGRRKRRARR